ncbi:MAG: hypothetical protein ACRDQ4_03595 [Pseudonocardiaceae bacterium]
MSGDPAPQSPESAGEGHPMVLAPRWGVSSADWQSHAIDEDADHPSGVYVARCGQRLRGAATLYDEAPGWMCVSCLRWTERGDTGEEGGAG